MPKSAIRYVNLLLKHIEELEREKASGLRKRIPWTQIAKSVEFQRAVDLALQHAHEHGDTRPLVRLCTAFAKSRYCSVILEWVCDVGGFRYRWTKSRGLQLRKRKAANTNVTSSVKLREALEGASGDRRWAGGAAARASDEHRLSARRKRGRKRRRKGGDAMWRRLPGSYGSAQR